MTDDYGPLGLAQFIHEYQEITTASAVKAQVNNENSPADYIKFSIFEAPPVNTSQKLEVLLELVRRVTY